MNKEVNHPFYSALRLLLKIPVCVCLRLFGRFSLWGAEHLPAAKRGCIVIANHAAFVDSVYLICSLRPRFIICGAKEKYFRHPLVRQIFHIANILKVSGKEQFINECSTLINAGNIILIYPEMGRNFDGLGEFSTWAAETALQTRAAVHPCYLYGTTRGQDGPKKLLAGPVIQPHGDAASLTNTFRSAIIDLKEKAMDTHQ